MKSKYLAWLLVILIGGLAFLSESLYAVGGREIKPLKQWSGRLERSLWRNHPAKNVLTSQAELDKLWAAWRLPQDKPAVDFQTQLLLVATCTCSIISVSSRLDDAGNLTLGVTITKDLAEDAAYIIALLPRQGIRTVEGKPLP